MNYLYKIENQKEQDEYEQRFDPDHPYCTNWPVNKKRRR